MHWSTITVKTESKLIFVINTYNLQIGLHKSFTFSEVREEEGGFLPNPGGGILGMDGGVGPPVACGNIMGRAATSGDDTWTNGCGAGTSCGGGDGENASGAGSRPPPGGDAISGGGEGVNRLSWIERSTRETTRQGIFAKLAEGQGAGFFAKASKGVAGVFLQIAHCRVRSHRVVDLRCRWRFA
jgi:hypothetical protein